MDEIKAFNEALMNQAFTLPIDESLVETVQEGDVIRNYFTDEEGVKRFAFKRLDQWYYMPLNNDKGGWIKTIDWDTFTEFQSKYGKEFKPYGALPKEEVI